MLVSRKSQRRNVNILAIHASCFLVLVFVSFCVILFIPSCNRETSGIKLVVVRSYIGPTRERLFLIM